MDNAVGHEELTIALHEIGGGETLAGVFHLGIAEGKPYLVHLIGSEESLDDLDVGAQESHILQSFVQGLRSTCPHAGSLDVHTDEVHIGI